MKKLIFALIMLAGGTLYSQTLISSLTSAVYVQSIANDGTRYQVYGQSFKPSANYILDSALVKLKKGTGATGNVNMKIYAHTGTYGTGGTGNGSALASSNTIDMSTVSESAGTWYKFTFTGSDAITLTSGTTYVIAVTYAGTTPSSVYRNTTSSSHAGNASGIVTSTWISTVADMGHYVYGHSASTTSVKSINAVTQATISKLAGVTMSGVKKFNGVANQ